MALQVRPRSFTCNTCNTCNTLVPIWQVPPFYDTFVMYTPAGLKIAAGLPRSVGAGGTSHPCAPAVVVGAGIVGLCFARDLATLGHKVRPPCNHRVTSM